jgi:hypothetical protein
MNEGLYIGRRSDGVVTCGLLCFEAVLKLGPLPYLLPLSCGMEGLLTSKQIEPVLTSL